MGGNEQSHGQVAERAWLPGSKGWSEGMDLRASARVMAAIYVVCGGAVAVVVSLVPQPSGSNVPAMVGICLCGVVLGPVIWVLPWQRWPRRASLVLGVAAFGFISGFDAASAVDGYRYAVFYVVVFAWLGLVQPRGTSVVITPVLTGAYLGPLVAAGQGWDSATASVFYAVPACVVTGEAVAWVSEQLRRARRSLVEAHEALGQRELLNAVGEMASTIGHELRNPLATAMNALYLARARASGTDPATLEKNLGVAERALDRATGLSDELLSSMTEHVPRMQAVAVRQVVEEVIVASPPPPGVDVEVGQVPDRVRADPSLLAQMVSNVVRNAYEAMEDGGTLRITGTVDGTGSDLVVEDTGPGVRPDLLDRVFDPFVTSKVRGLGLGLTTVRKLARAQGGDVSIKAGEPVGTRVSIHLRNA